MKAYALHVSSAAREEVAEALAYIAAERSPDAAMRWLDGLEAVMQSLLDMPERFPVAPEDTYFPHGTLRRALYHKHRVLFSVDGNVVRVFRVRHGMRDDLSDET